MEPLEFGYNLILHTLGYWAVPYVWGKTRQDPLFFRGRLGRYASDAGDAEKPRVWFHAASVGEVAGAIPILRAFHERVPRASLFLTVGTPQGYRFAIEELPAWVRIFPFPLDFPWVLKRVFRSLKPDLYVALESEFWPNLFRFLIQKRIPSVLLNGRLSSSSARRYKRLWPLFRPIFQHFRWLAMHSEEDRKNVLDLGVPPERTLTLGSSKYDGLLARSNPERAAFWRRLLRIPSGIPVLVGGSLRGNECTKLLEVFLGVKGVDPDLVGIFAPRHMHRIPEMVAWLEGQGVAFQYLSRLESGEEKRETAVVLVDRIGVLFELYSLGDLIFCGGTFEPIGGHNILEPAAWGKAVFYGPYHQKVYAEHSILQAFGGSFLAQDHANLLEQWRLWVKDLEGLKIHGAKAGEALRELAGVTAKQVELILKAFPEGESEGFLDHAEA